MNDTSLESRAKVILEGIDDEIADWFIAGCPNDLMTHLGMTPQEYATFLFKPQRWAIDYVVSLHGE